MNPGLFFITLAGYLPYLAGAAICVYPMENRFRGDPEKKIPRLFALVFLLICVATVLDCLLKPGYNVLGLPLLIPLYLIYARSVDVPVHKSLTIFLLASALMSIAGNVAIGFDAALHPESDVNHFSTEAVLLQLALSAAIAFLLKKPLEKYGGWLVENLNIPYSWDIEAVICCTFLALNLLLYPASYETLYEGDLFLIYWGSLILMTLLLGIQCAFFYFVVSSILDEERTAARNRFLEMQEHQYRAQQRYMDATSRARHDFRQTIRTLQELMHAGDYKAAQEYLDDYASSLPVNEIRHLSDNAPLNALLNHYSEVAEQNQIPLKLRVELPAELPLSDIDLCNMVGNILENAVQASLDIKPEERQIQLTMTTQNDAQLCIVAANHFNGRVRRSNGVYLTTRWTGNGIGLSSITSTAEHYGGTADFSHEGKVFYSNVMIPLTGREE